MNRMRLSDWYKNLAWAFCDRGDGRRMRGADRIITSRRHQSTQKNGVAVLTSLGIFGIEQRHPN